MAPAFALASNPMAGLWRSYNRLQCRRPLLCSMGTSAVLWATGDVVSQHVQQAARRSRQRGSSSCGDGADNEGGPLRVLATGTFGGLVFGPLGHLWYACLDGLVAGLGRPGTLPFLFAKVLADSFIFTPLYVGLFMAYNSLLVSRSGPEGATKKLQEDFLPTVAAEVMIWPPIMAMLFATVPLSHQLLAVNAVTVADVALLSWLEEHDLSELTAALPFASTVPTFVRCLGETMSSMSSPSPFHGQMLEYAAGHSCL